MRPNLISFRHADILPLFKKLKEIPHGRYFIPFGLGLEGGNGAQIYFVGRPYIVFENGDVNKKMSDMFREFLREKRFEFGLTTDPSPYKNIVDIDKAEALRYVLSLVNIFLASNFGISTEEIEFSDYNKRGGVYFNL